MTSPSLNIQMCKRTTTSLSVDGHLDCFHVLAIVNSASMNNGIHVSFLILVSLGCMPRSGIDGFIPSFLRNLQLSSMVAVSVYIPTNSAPLRKF